MLYSDNTAELDKALAKAQSELKPAVKNARGHGYNYAALEEVTEAAIEALSNNGITINQGLEELDGGRVRCVTRLAHQGQWMITFCPLRIASKSRNNEMQELGSAYTYARRYALQAAVGIAPITKEDFERRAAVEAHSWGSDDDGASSGPKPQQHQANKSSSRPSKTQTFNIESVKSDIARLGANIDLVQDFVMLNRGGKTLAQLVSDNPGDIPLLIKHIKDNLNSFTDE